MRALDRLRKTWLPAVGRPNLKSHAERFIQTLKVGLLDGFVTVAPKQLDYVCRIWRWHYNHDRPHDARGYLPPGLEELPEANETVRLNDVVDSSRLGGLLKHYARRAA